MYNNIDKIFSAGKAENGCTRGKLMGVGVFADTEGEPSFESNQKTWGLVGYPLASVYAPVQSFDKLYDPDTALERGTVFEELDLPFEGDSVFKGGIWRG